MHHMMIDTETLGTGARPVLLSVGWCVFDPDTMVILDRGEDIVNTDSCRRLGGEVDDSTIRWWLSQTDAARKGVQPKEGDQPLQINQALINLATAYKHHGCRRAWSHGATFDLPILAEYYRRAQLLCPWAFYDARDTRTVFEMAGDTLGVYKRPKPEVAHSAVADAVQQTEDLMAALAAIRALKPAA